MKYATKHSPVPAAVQAGLTQPAMQAVFREVRSLLTPEGAWGQGDDWAWDSFGNPASPHSSQAVRWCLGGAFHRVAGPTRSRSGAIDAINWLDLYIRYREPEMTRDWLEPLPHGRYGSPRSTIAYSEMVDMDQAGILELLDEVLALEYITPESAAV